MLPALCQAGSLPCAYLVLSRWPHCFFFFKVHASVHLTFIQCFLTPPPLPHSRKVEDPDPIPKELTVRGGGCEWGSNSVCGTMWHGLQGRHRSLKGAPIHLSVKCGLCPAEVWGAHPETSGSVSLRIRGEGVAADTFSNVNSRSNNC